MASVDGAVCRSCAVVASVNDVEPSAFEELFVLVVSLVLDRVGSNGSWALLASEARKDSIPSLFCLLISFSPPLRLLSHVEIVGPVSVEISDSSVVRDFRDLIDGAVSEEISDWNE